MAGADRGCAFGLVATDLQPEEAGSSSGLPPWLSSAPAEKDKAPASADSSGGAELGLGGGAAPSAGGAATRGGGQRMLARMASASFADSSHSASHAASLGAVAAALIRGSAAPRLPGARCDGAL